MARVHVHGADFAGAHLSALRVRMHGLPARTITRDEAVSWLRDGHSLLLARGETAVQLVDLASDEGPAWALRTDNAKEASDLIEGLPAVSGAGV